MNDRAVICPVCEQGTLTVGRYSDEVEYDGQKLMVNDLERTQCNQCGADPVLTEQIRRNQVRICDAKRRASGYLTGEEIRAVRERLSLSQAEAALLFGGGPMRSPSTSGARSSKASPWTASCAWPRPCPGPSHFFDPIWALTL